MADDKSFVFVMRGSADIEPPDATLEDVSQQYRTGCDQQQNLGQCRTDIEVLHLT